MATKTTVNTVEERLTLLSDIQTIDSRIDEIQKLKGELPIEVADLEDEIEGLGKRLERIKDEISGFEEAVAGRKIKKKEAEALIQKYTKQQGNVKNNREFDALTKEIELQNLEIQISDKRMKESGAKIEAHKEFLKESEELIKTRTDDLAIKKVELDKIIVKTEKDEKKLTKDRAALVKKTEERLMNAYNRIRGKYRNGLAVVSISRNACGGCFNSIPPQVQLEIGAMKRVIQCENCARILVPFHEEEA